MARPASLKLGKKARQENVVLVTVFTQWVVDPGESAHDTGAVRPSHDDPGNRYRRAGQVPRIYLLKLSAVLLEQNHLSGHRRIGSVQTVEVHTAADGFTGVVAAVPLCGVSSRVLRSELEHFYARTRRIIDGDLSNAA